MPTPFLPASLFPPYSFQPTQPRPVAVMLPIVFCQSARLFRFADTPCWSSRFHAAPISTAGQTTSPVGGYSQLLILPMRGKSLPPPSSRPAINPTHYARASPPIIGSLARRELIILRIAPDRAGPSARERSIPSRILWREYFSNSLPPVEKR